MVLDAKRASLHAEALTETYVKPTHLRDTKRCWLLKRCTYGTLPAAAGWQHIVQKVGADIGLLSASKLSMCIRARLARFGHVCTVTPAIAGGSEGSPITQRRRKGGGRSVVSRCAFLHFFINYYSTFFIFFIFPIFSIFPFFSFFFFFHFFSFFLFFNSFFFPFHFFLL